MRKLLLSQIFFVISLSMHSQLVYGGIGYNASFVKLDGVNKVVDDYNSIRDFLDVEMKQFRMLDGAKFEFGFAVESVFTSMSVDLARQKRHAEGTDATNMLQRREVSVSYNRFQITTGFGAFEEEGGIGLGVRAGFGNFKVKSRVYPKEGDKVDWEDVSRDLGLNLGPALKIILGEDVYVGLDIYYTFGLFEVSSNDLSIYLNGIDYAEEVEPTNRTNLFGFSLILAGGGGW